MCLNSRWLRDCNCSECKPVYPPPTLTTPECWALAGELRDAKAEIRTLNTYLARARKELDAERACYKQSCNERELLRQENEAWKATSNEHKRMREEAEEKARDAWQQTAEYNGAVHAEACKTITRQRQEIDRLAAERDEAIKKYCEVCDMKHELERKLEAPSICATGDPAKLAKWFNDGLDAAIMYVLTVESTIKDWGATKDFILRGLENRRRGAEKQVFPHRYPTLATMHDEGFNRGVEACIEEVTARKSMGIAGYLFSGADVLINQLIERMRTRLKKALE